MAKNESPKDTIASIRAEQDKLTKSVEKTEKAVKQLSKAYGGVNVPSGGSGGGGVSSSTGTGGGTSRQELGTDNAKFTTAAPSSASGNTNGGGPASFGGFGNPGGPIGALSGLPFIGKAFGLAGTVMNAGATAMPQIEDVMNYSAGYYGASVMSGFGGTMGSRKMMQNATFGAISARGGMTSAGADAKVASLLTSRGMFASSDPNSTYMQTVGTSANIAKYLNMPVEQAASAVEGLTSGAGASNMLRNYGIFVSDPTTGKEKPMNQIFEELAQRLQLKGSNAERTMKSLRSGSLSVVAGQIGQQFGGDSARLFSQYMIDRVGGNGTEWAGSGMSEKVGENNPLSASYDIYASETKQYGKAEESYIQGFKDLVPTLTSLNDISGELAKNFGTMNVFLQGFAGNPVVKGASDIIGGISDLFKGGGGTGMGTGFTANSGGQAGGMGTGFSGGAGSSRRITLNSGGESGGATAAAGGASSSGGGSQGTKVFRLARPVGGRITLGYNVKDANHKNGHTGVDFACEVGTPVQACADGTVSYVGTSQQPGGGFGRYMKVMHADGFETLYAHLSSWVMGTGDKVTTGQVIARSGNTGHTTGPHLHLTLYKNGAQVDPSPYLGGSVPVTGDMSPSKSGLGANEAAAQGIYEGVAGVVTANAAGVSSSLQTIAAAIGAVRSTAGSGYSSTASSNSTSAVTSETGGQDSGMLAGLTTSAAGSSGIDAANIVSMGGSSSGYSPSVTINVQIANASDIEARRLATMVKKIIKEDSHIEKMGRH